MESNQFVLIFSAEEHFIGLYNLTQISSVLVIDGGIQIRMGNGDSMNLSGSSAGALLKMLIAKSVTPEGISGESLAQHLESIVSKDRKAD